MGDRESKSLGASVSPWRTPECTPSLPEIFESIRIPPGAKGWRRLLAFIGPGYLVAVGYMDPGNWATDIAGGSAYSYALLSAVLFSSLIAIFLQTLSVRLGIATGRDLAQACRDTYPKPVNTFLWISAEIGILACDLAEVIGAAIALNLLFHLPLVLGVILTGADVLLVLALQHRGFRWIEWFVMLLILGMMGIFSAEILWAKPNWLGVAHGMLPSRDLVRNPAMLFLALGILGATVMPHNLYLHSSIVQTRHIGKSSGAKKEAIRNATIDLTIALCLAFLVNAAILIVAAATFYRVGNHKVSEIQDAYRLLTPIVGATIAAPLFAVALLASGQNSTLTGTLAGQIVLEGFTRWKLAPWLRRLVSRSIAIVPAVVVVYLAGEKGLGSLIVWSQVILSIQLSFAVFPLVQITSDRGKMGEHVNGPFIRALGWLTAVAILALNSYLVWSQLTRR